MNIQHFSLESHDFTEMEQALSAWDHRYAQMSEGKFTGKLLHVQADSLGVLHNRWERAIHYQGVAPPGTLGIGVTLAQVGDARWNGQLITRDDLILSRCNIENDYLSGSLWDSIILAIPETGLAQQISDITQRDPLPLLTKFDRLRATPRMAALLRKTCSSYLLAAARPEPCRDTVQEMMQRTIEVLAQALISAQPGAPEKDSLKRQQQLIKDAIDYSAGHPERPVRIYQLCRAIGASERSLRDAFHKSTGIGPLNYLKKERLSRVYRRLSSEESSQVLVKQAATENGFTHLGQFTGDYKQLFGELPSTTLSSHQRILPQVCARPS